MLDKIKKYKYLIIIIIIIIVIFIVIMINNKNSKKKPDIPEIDARSTSEITASVNKSEKEKIAVQFSENLDEANMSLFKVFQQVGASPYSLDAYANDMYVDVDYGSIKDIESYAKDSLDESIDFYDTEGNKIDIKKNLYNEEVTGVNEKTGAVSGIPVPTYNGNRVEISDYSNFKIGNYYLIKYYVPFSNYTYYYISQLTSAGFQNFQLYVISTNETYKRYSIDESMLEMTEQQEDINY